MKNGNLCSFACFLFEITDRIFMNFDFDFCTERYLGNFI